MDVPAGTIIVFSDIGCPWASAAVHRLRATRRRLGLDGRVVLDHRPFPLELFNGQPTPKLILDVEVPVAGALVPDAGWRPWRAPAHEWPVTTLPGLEAVLAAKEQGLAASEELDAGLRRALYAESRCVSMRHVIVDVAAGCDGVNGAKLAEALDDGRHRRAVADGVDEARAHAVQGSPHLFLPGGSDAHNPGVRMRWVGRPGEGFPVVDEDDSPVYERLVAAAAG